MDINSIPLSLRHLIPLIKKWGIEDDGYRDEIVYSSNTSELMEFVSKFSASDLSELNKWLSSPGEIKVMSEEYSKFSALLMSFEYATALLESGDEAD